MIATPRVLMFEEGEEEGRESWEVEKDAHRVGIVCVVCSNEARRSWQLSHETKPDGREIILPRHRVATHKVAAARVLGVHGMI